MEEEAVVNRSANTNEDSPNVQHAPHRPVQDRQEDVLPVNQSCRRIRPVRIRRNTDTTPGFDECLASVHP